MKTGRPTLYNLEIAEEICYRLANGESLTKICEQAENDPVFPSEAAVYAWLRNTNISDEDHAIFIKMYTRARKNQAHAYADATVAIPDKLQKQWESKEILDFNELRELTKLAELRTKNRQWHAARLLPRKYGTQENATVKSNARVDVGVTDVSDLRAKLLEKLSQKSQEKDVVILNGDVESSSDELIKQ